MRGVGFTVAGLFVLYMLLWLASLVLLDGEQGPDPGWASFGAVAGLVIASVVVRRRLRGWAARPRWLIPAAVVVFGLALVPAAMPFNVDGRWGSTSCTALVDAWHPVVAVPSPSDIEVYKSTFDIPGGSELSDPMKRNAFLASTKEIEASPEYQRVWAYVLWALGSGPCAPRAKAQLALSALLLGTGTALIAGGVRRRRGRREGLAEDPLVPTFTG